MTVSTLSSIVMVSCQMTIQHASTNGQFSSLSYIFAHQFSHSSCLVTMQRKFQECVTEEEKTSYTQKYQFPFTFFFRTFKYHL